MFTTFTLLIAVGVCFRLALNWVLQRHFSVRFAAPQALAGALVVLAGLPDWLKPLPYPLPLSLTIGLLLPDLFLRGK
jgi:hypothetical protein